MDNEQAACCPQGGMQKMGPDEIKELKKAMRREIMEQVSALDPKYCIQADEAIFRAVTGLKEYIKASVIFCFMGRRSEIDTAPIITHALSQGKRVAVPKCTGKGIMKACLIHSLKDLKAGAYGISEPDDSAPRLEPEEIGLAVIPCLSCSSSGKRLGYGGGYYDRYLMQVKGVKAVICRGEIMREDIPVEKHDQAVDMVIWENGIRRVSGRVWK